LGLPSAISGHQNYYYWGPRDYTGEVVIALGMNPGELGALWGDVRPAGYVHHLYAMPYENFVIYVCRKPKQSLQAMWPDLKKWN
jgi:hypothetical protein